MITRTRKLLKELAAVLGMGPERPEGSLRRRRVVIAVSGGVNAPAAIDVLPGLARAPFSITAIHARRPDRPSHSPAVKSAVAWIARSAPVTTSELTASDPAHAIALASRDAELLVLGASDGVRAVSNSFISAVVRESLCPVAVVGGCKFAASRTGARRRALIVASDSRAGAERLAPALALAMTGTSEHHLLLARARAANPAERVRPSELPGSFGSVQRSSSPLDARRLLQLGQGRHDLVLVAAESGTLERDGSTLDELFAKTRLPVVCLFPAGRAETRMGMDTNREAAAAA